MHRKSCGPFSPPPPVATDYIIIVSIMISVFILLDCRNSSTDWGLKAQSFLWFHRLEPESRVPVWLVPGEGLCPGLQTATFRLGTRPAESSGFSSSTCCSVSKTCLTLCDPRDARPPCPSPSPRVCSNSYPLSQWCSLIISSSATPFSSCPQSFPASESIPRSQLFTSGGQSDGASASASVLPMNIHGLFPLWLVGLISLQSERLFLFFFFERLLRVFSNTTVQNINSSAFTLLYGPTLTSICDY